MFSSYTDLHRWNKDFNRNNYNNNYNQYNNGYNKNNFAHNNNNQHVNRNNNVNFNINNDYMADKIFTAITLTLYNNFPNMAGTNTGC